MVALSNEDVETLNRYAKYQRKALVASSEFRVNILTAIIRKPSDFVQPLIKLSALCPWHRDRLIVMPVRPYPPGTRVRHHGQQYPEARSGTATVLRAKPQG